MKRLLLFVALLGMFAVLQIPMNAHMAEKPVAEKVGFIANPQLMRLTSADHKQAVSALLSFKSLNYYGVLVDQTRKQNQIPVDYDGLYRLLTAATRLDPYNQDPYYFAQSVLVWEVGAIDEVIQLLEYGINYRDWDWSLPFWAGFNSAKFLQDFDSASKYFQQAAKVSGEAFFSRLASRYLFESGQTGYAITYLEAMIKEARKPAIRKSFELRLVSLKNIQILEKAIASYSQRKGKQPSSLEEMVAAGELERLPVDPFGGKYFLDETGKPRSTKTYFAPRNLKPVGSM